MCLTFEDGTIEILEHDLTSQHSQIESESYMHSTPRDSVSKVSRTFCLDIATARKGILRGRLDILATLEGQHGADSKDVLIVITSTSSPNRSALHHLFCFALPSRFTPGVSVKHQYAQPQLLLDYALLRPRSLQDSSYDSHFELHFSSGRLFQVQSGTCTSYDLSGTAPKILSNMSILSEEPLAACTLDPSTIVVASSKVCKIYSVTYCSEQVEQSLALTTQQKASRSVQDGAKGQATNLLGHFADLGLLIATQGNALVAMQLDMPKHSHHHQNASAGLLAEAMGRGAMQVKIINEASPSPGTLKAWEQWTAEVDRLADDGNVEELEKFLAHDLNIARKTSKPTSATDKEHAEPEDLDTTTASMPNGVHEADKVDQQLPNDHPVKGQASWGFPKHASAVIAKTQMRKAYHCLRKLFVLDQDASSSNRLSVALYSPDIFHWLAITGYMSCHHILRAFTHDDHRAIHDIRKGALVGALVELDPSFGILQDFLHLSICIDAEEVVQALKSVVQSLDASSATSAGQKLLNGTSEQKAHDESEDRINLESDAAEADLAFAVASLNDGLSTRSGLLRAIFTRLTAMPSSTIVHLLRDRLDAAEIVFLITLLRIELADGGWTVRYLDEPDDFELDDFSNSSSCVIAKLLNIAIDAIGTSGWLVSLSGDPNMSTDEMLLILRAEITAAIEGCSEAENLKVNLDDFVRYSRRADEAKGGPLAKKRKHEITTTMDDDDEAILPLGFTVDTIDMTSVSKGGRVSHKSRQLIGQELSMRVGRHTIDHIRV